MASDRYLRGRLWWWRWRPSRHDFEKYPITIRISLKTGCAKLAEHRRIRLEASMDGAKAMQNFQIGAEDQAKFFKSFAQSALDRIIGDRIAIPSPFHDRINMAHARLCAFHASSGAEPDEDFMRQTLEDNGCTEEEILDLLITKDVYAKRPPISDGKVAAHLAELGLAPVRYNIDRARLIALAAMSKACIDATQRFAAEPVQLRVPTPPAMVFFKEPEPEAPAPIVPVQETQVAIAAPALERPKPTRDAPFSEVVKIVVATRQGQGLWDQKRGNEVMASAKLFIHANGDIAFSEVSQQHFHSTLLLMNRLPQAYNHYMVAGKGGFAAALASVAPPTNPTDETAAQTKAREDRKGLHGATRNKHFTWLKAIIDGAKAAGFADHVIDFKELRLTPKQLRKTDPRKPNEKRPNWTVPAFRTLTSGPVHSGCATIDRRFAAGEQVIHDGTYWGPLINLNICGRPSEAAGLAVDDIFDDGAHPYIFVRRNKFRKLKVDEGERKVPIHPKLIALGFLDYVRKIRALGYEALFPEWVHPTSALDFAWMMRNSFMDPARKHLFPNGTGLASFGKEPDGHSLRGTGRTALRDFGVDESIRDYLSGHIHGTTGVDVYETPAGPALLGKAIKALDDFFMHLQPFHLNCRPADRLKFGSQRGRPKT